MKIIVSLLIATSLSFAGPIILGQNLIVNPGAEQGAGSADGNDVLTVPGWTTTGNFTSVQYGASAAPVADPGPSFGANFFAGGPNSDTDMATQLIDASSIAPLIDLGQAAYNINGWFGGFEAQNDTAELFLTFFDGSNIVLENSVTIGGHNSTFRNSISQLLFDSGSGLIPVGTRSVEVTLEMIKTEGFYNDGYADNLSFTASSTAVPEPSALLLASAGIAGLVLLRRKA